MRSVKNIEIVTDFYHDLCDQLRGTPDVAIPEQIIRRYTRGDFSVIADIFKMQSSKCYSA